MFLVRECKLGGMRGTGINGIGLSMVIPSGQSMVADYYPEDRRGAAFGALYLTGALGAMLGEMPALRYTLSGASCMQCWLWSLLWSASKLNICYADCREGKQKQV